MFPRAKLLEKLSNVLVMVYTALLFRLHLPSCTHTRCNLKSPCVPFTLSFKCSAGPNSRANNSHQKSHKGSSQGSIPFILSDYQARRRQKFTGFLSIEPSFLPGSLPTAPGIRRQGGGGGYRALLPQTALIKAAQKTNHIATALIYTQLKFHVN